jgi:hypothetical protein
MCHTEFATTLLYYCCLPFSGNLAAFGSHTLHSLQFTFDNISFSVLCVSHAAAVADVRVTFLLPYFYVEL